jgi:carbon-monoxide dehydrogenase large subunit
MADGTGIGASILRKEDKRFLTGKGNYVADLKLRNMAHGVFLRSHHAHAVIKGIDTAAALAMPGVVAIFTGTGWRPTTSAASDGGITNVDGTPMKSPPSGAGARQAALRRRRRRLRHRGRSRRAAAEAVESTTMLPAVVSMLDAIRPGATAIFDDVPDNTCFDWECGDAKATAEAFKQAAHIARISLVNNRLVGNPMEPRAAVADYDTGRDHYTLWTTSQFPHIVKLLMGNFVLHIPQHKLRVVAPDVGGGFGKQFLYAEEASLTWARQGRPAGQIGSTKRSASSPTRRAATTSRTPAGARCGRPVHSPQGPHHRPWAATCRPSGLTSRPTSTVSCSRASTTPAIHYEVKGVFTNTIPVDAYGAGRPGDVPPPSGWSTSPPPRWGSTAPRSGGST